MYNRQNKSSLEDAVRSVQQRYKNRPSPLIMMQNNPGFVPTHVPDHMAPKKNFRDALLDGFKPQKYTF